MNKIKEKVQKEALNKLIENNGGLISLETGVGKSKIAIDYIKQGNFRNVLITSPRTSLKENWLKELKKWYNENNPLIKSGSYYFETCVYTIENIQTCYKWDSDVINSFDVIILDEWHTTATPKYSLIMEKKNSILIGLTATPELNKPEKKELSDKYCPLVFDYDTSAEDGLINKVQYYIVEHELSDDWKVMGGTKKHPFLIGEASQYAYLTQNIKKGQIGMKRVGSTNWWNDAKKWGWDKDGTDEQQLAAIKYLNAIKFRKEFLLGLNSTANISKKLIRTILSENNDNKVLIFSERIEQIIKMTKHIVHGKQNQKLNAINFYKFDKGQIRDLGSVQSLTLGVNIKNPTHSIIESYVGSSTVLQQRKGRNQRLNINEIAHVFIFRVVNTQAGESWFDKATKNLDLSNAITFKSYDIKY